MLFVQRLARKILKNGRKEICTRNLEVLATAFRISISKCVPPSEARHYEATKRIAAKAPDLFVPDEVFI